MRARYAEEPVVVTVTITVHDGNEGPLANATVSGSWSGASSGDGACVTDAVGQCSVESAHVHKKNDGMTFTVTTVSLASNSYVAADNHDPDSDSSGTAITSHSPARHRINRRRPTRDGPDGTDSDDSGANWSRLTRRLIRFGRQHRRLRVVGRRLDNRDRRIADGHARRRRSHHHADRHRRRRASDTDQVTVVVYRPTRPTRCTRRPRRRRRRVRRVNGRRRSPSRCTTRQNKRLPRRGGRKLERRFSGADYSCTTGAGGQCSVTRARSARANASMTFHGGRRDRHHAHITTGRPTTTRTGTARHRDHRKQTLSRLQPCSCWSSQAIAMCTRLASESPPSCASPGPVGLDRLGAEIEVARDHLVRLTGDDLVPSPRARAA